MKKWSRLLDKNGNRLESLSPERRALLAQLLREKAGAKVDNEDPAPSDSYILTPRPEERYEAFPLTDIQQAYWIGRNNHFDLGGVGTHGYEEIYRKEIDASRLEYAINYLIQRHEMLRMVVTPDGMQRILKN